MIWAPILFLTILCLVITGVEAYLVEYYWYSWMDELEYSSYICTDSDLEIDFDVIREEFKDQGYAIYPLLIYCGSCMLFVCIIGHYCAHYNMMMKWMRENPKESKAVARSISVGLPPDAPVEVIEHEHPTEGHVVPEADREV